MQGKEQSMSLIAMVAAMAICAASAYGAAGDVQPTNDLPNPYHTIAPWGDLPGGMSGLAPHRLATQTDSPSLSIATVIQCNAETSENSSPSHVRSDMQRLFWPPTEQRSFHAR